MTKKPNIDKAFIFAAGLGTRLKPLTDELPKPMVEVKGKKLVDYSIEFLRNSSISQIAVNSFYKKEILNEYLQASHPEVKIFEEAERLETAGGLLNAKSFTAGDHIVTANSDIIIFEDEKGKSLSDLIGGYDAEKFDLFMLLVKKENALGYEGEGDFNLSEGSKLEKSEQNDLVYTGVAIINTTILQNFGKKIFSLSEVFKALLHQGKLGGIVMEGSILHVGSIDGLNQAEKFLEENESKNKNYKISA